MTRLGQDPFSTAMMQSWEDEGIGTDLVVWSDTLLPGLYFIETTEGERSFYYWRGKSAAKFWINSSQGSDIYDRLAELDVLYVSGISLDILDEGARETLFSLFRQVRSREGQ